jgi:glycosyltransferase involved in cell wall biosynthesis
MINQNPTVSICCITYNHARFIAHAMESFIMQQTNFQFEIVVGNDCSTDGTLEVLEGFKKQYPGKITLVSTKKKHGPAS